MACLLDRCHQIGDTAGLCSRRREVACQTEVAMRRQSAEGGPAPGQGQGPLSLAEGPHHGVETRTGSLSTGQRPEATAAAGVQKVGFAGQFNPHFIL